MITRNKVVLLSLACEVAACCIKSFLLITQQCRVMFAEVAAEQQQHMLLCKLLTQTVIFMSRSLTQRSGCHDGLQELRVQESTQCTICTY